MDVKQAYNIWSGQYDSNLNPTRDLEAIAIRETLDKLDFENCLEIGCGTGKNTEWLVSKAKLIIAVDLSDKMLEKAKQKISLEKVRFIQADITKPWNFLTNPSDLIIFSLVLEHVENLDFVFEEASKNLKLGGYIYIGELHPYKQYKGTKARFETEDGLQIVQCFNHNISDFTRPAMNFGFEIISFEEYFDNDDKSSVPRILCVLLRKR